jgi:hypothetical protein
LTPFTDVWSLQDGAVVVAIAIGSGAFGGQEQRYG